MFFQRCLPDVLNNQQPLQFLAAFLGILNIWNGGLHSGWSSPFMPKLLSNDSYLKLNEDDILWIPIAMPVGALCGAIISACFMNKLGRKRVILMANALFIASALLIALAKSLTILLVGRLLGGFADAISFSSVPVYIAEVSEPKVRGFLLSGVTFAWSFGILSINIFGLYVTIPLASYISLSVALLALVTFFWMPETPHFFILNNQIEEAKACIKRLRKNEDVEPVFNDLNEAVKLHKEATKNFVQLLTDKSNRKSLIIMLGITFTQQLCGANSIMFYGNTIFQEAGTGVTPETTSIIYFSVFLIFSGACALVVEKFGRKPLMIVSIIGTGAAVFLLATYLYIKTITHLPSSISILPLICFVIYISFYALGVYSVGLIVAGEIFPLGIRSAGESLYVVCYHICTIIVLELFEVFKNANELYILFYIFAVCCGLGLIFIIFCVPETTGITLEEIESNLRN